MIVAVLEARRLNARLYAKLLSVLLNHLQNSLTLGKSDPPLMALALLSNSYCASLLIMDRIFLFRGGTPLVD